MTGQNIAAMNISLHLFATAVDAEAAQYRVLAGLQRARRAFAQNRVSPHLDALVALQADLQSVLDGAQRVEKSAAAPAVGVDWETGRLTRAAPAAPVPVDLARWALPRLAEVVAEGQALYAFAEECARLAAVGLVPAYRDEGFLLVSSDDGGPVHALRYRLSPLTGADGRTRGLRTDPVPVDLDPLAPPPVWKRALAAAAPDLPAPATFRLRADVPLPVEETLLPVAKRKLLGLVQTWGVA